jgi:hypothetical protein
MALLTLPMPPSPSIIDNRIARVTLPKQLVVSLSLRIS